jgi:ubiquinone/menaquinone biosynthesis C-methylase UbiE
MLIPAENFGGEYTALRWICRLLLAPTQELTEVFMGEPEVASWYEYLKQNELEKLQEYINYKYHFLPLSNETHEGREAGRRLRFLEDFILFSNPDRELWEKTKKILKKLHIREGITIADVGCGSGYFTFKFADMTGPEGKVYGIEINPMHLDYLRGFVRKHDITNVEIVESQSNGIGLEPGTQVDLVFSCSLFHVLYAVFSEEDRREFLESISNTIVPGGALIVMDNDLVEDGDLPYHGPYIAKDLLISQLHYYSFKQKKKVQETVQRYALVFEKRRDKPPQKADDRTDFGKSIITATSGVSLVKYALADAVPIMKYTEGAKLAAELFMSALTEKTPESIEAAIAAYEKIIPVERIGDEYTAFVWFCEYLKADEQARELMLSDALAKEYHDYFSGDDYALLKRYLTGKYELAGSTQPSTDGGAGQDLAFESKVGTMDDMMRFSEYMSFNNPARERWEKTSQMLEFIGVKQGETIADVGCGSGYFTYKFANLVGESGKVFATELNEAALSYVVDMRDRYGLNIETVVSALNDTKLPAGQCDKVFMCSMYHAVYVSSIEFVKDAFIDSIKKALKDGGQLIIVDNDIRRDGVPEYYGSAIDRRLIINQLTHYGFRLVGEKQFIPQRYVLVFE